MGSGKGDGDFSGGEGELRMRLDQAWAWLGEVRIVEAGGAQRSCYFAIWGRLILAPAGG